MNAGNGSDATTIDITAIFRIINAADFEYNISINLNLLNKTRLTQVMHTIAKKNNRKTAKQLSRFTNI